MTKYLRRLIENVIGRSRPATRKPHHARLMVEALETRLAPAVTWDGSESTDWENPDNWTPPGIPRTTDDLVFDQAQAQRSCTLSSNRTVASIQLKGDAVGTFTLEITSDYALTVNGEENPSLMSSDWTVLVEGNLYIENGVFEMSDGYITVSLFRLGGDAAFMDVYGQAKQFSSPTIDIGKDSQGNITAGSVLTFSLGGDLAGNVNMTDSEINIWRPATGTTNRMTFYQEENSDNAGGISSVGLINVYGQLDRDTDDGTKPLRIGGHVKVQNNGLVRLGRGYDRMLWIAG